MALISLINQIKLGDFSVFKNLLISYASQKIDIKGSIDEIMFDNLLHYACYYDMTGNFVDALLKFGFDPNVQNANNTTPLMYCISQKNFKGFKVMLDCQSLDINIVNGQKMSAFHLCCMLEDCDFINLLFDKKKDDYNFDLKDHEGKDVFFHLCNNFKVDISILEKFSKYCNINTYDNDLKSVLMTCTEKKSFNFLLKKKVNIDARDKDNNGIFHRLIIENSDKVEEILSARPNINMKGKGGMTPLMLAILFDNFKLFQKLIKLKANKDIKNNKGQTVKDIALSDKQLFKDYIALL